MVSYAGQMHTCRMCDSPTHVLANCPKQPRNLTTPSTIVVPDKAPEHSISKPDGVESSSDTDADAEDTSCVDLSVVSKSVKKKKMKETREFRDQQKQSKKGVALPLPIPPARKMNKLNLM